MIGSCCRTRGEFCWRCIKNINDWNKAVMKMEVGMGKKKYKYGDKVLIPGRTRGEKGIVVGMAGENLVGVAFDYGYYHLDIEDVKPLIEPQLSGEELADIFMEYCTSKGFGEGACNDCPLLEGDCRRDETIENVLRNHDQLVSVLTSYKAQKEQEKKKLFRPGDIVKYKLREGARPFIVTPESFESLSQDNYVLVCRAEDRVDK